jgi:hypothetical protein
MNTRLALAALLSLATLSFAEDAAPAAAARIPKPAFQNDFFGEMGRAHCTILEVDLKGRSILVKRDHDQKTVRVPIHNDTELHFRSSWGELADYFPGQHVMLFMYVDEDKNWTYPRAIQDDIHVSSAHGWFATVTAIDPKALAYKTHREEKNKEGAVTKSEDKSYTYAPTAKVWKSNKPGGIETLALGDAVIQQLVSIDGHLTAVELLTRDGDKAVREAQDKRHAADQERLGLPAYVTDVEPITGSVLLTVAWSGSERAKNSIHPGDTLLVTPEDGSHPFAAAVVSLTPTDSRVRLQTVTSAFPAAKLQLGQPVRVHLPSTNPALPTGKDAVPEAAYK